MTEPTSKYAPLPEIKDSPESFSLIRNSEESPKGVAILLHGLTATPSEMKPLGMYLNERGYNIIAPRITGHGVSIEELKQTSEHSWLEDANNALDEASRLSKQPPFVIGLSFGGLLALYLGSKRCSEIKGVAAISVPFKLKPLSHYLLLNTISYLPPQFLNILGTTQKSRRPYGYLAFHHNAFSEHSISAGARLLKIRRLVSKQLHNLTCPLLLLQDPLDHHLPLSVSQVIQQKTNCRTSSVHYFPNGQHELIIGHSHQQVFQVIYDFLEQTRKELST